MEQAGYIYSTALFFFSSTYAYESAHGHLVVRASGGLSNESLPRARRALRMKYTGLCQYLHVGKIISMPRVMLF